MDESITVTAIGQTSESGNNQSCGRGNSLSHQTGRLHTSILLLSIMFYMLFLLFFVELATLSSANAQEDSTHPRSRVEGMDINNSGNGGRDFISGLIERLRELRQKKLITRSKLAEIQDIDALTGDLNEITLELNTVESAFSEMKEMGDYGFGHLVELRGKAWKVDEKLKKVADKMAQRLIILEDEKKSWEQEWKTWDDFGGMPMEFEQIDAFRPMYNEAMIIITEIQQQIRGLYPSLSAFQSILGESQGRIQAIFPELEKTITGSKSDFFRRNAPPFYSSVFLKQFSGPPLSTTPTSPAKTSLLDTSFLSVKGWPLLFQVFIIVILALTIRYRRDGEETPDLWRFLGTRPWSSSILASLLAFSPLYRSYPSHWRMVLWILASITTIRVMEIVLKERWQKQTARLVLIPYILSLIIKALDMPLHYYRLSIVIIAVIGIPLLFRMAYSIKREVGPHYVFTHSLHGGGLLFGVIFIGQFFGYSAMANYLYDSAIKSVFLVIFTLMFDMFIKRLISLFLDKAANRNIKLVSRHREFLISRISIILDIIVVVVAITIFLSILGLYDTPMQAWKSINAIGLTVGQLTITLGTIILVIVIIYVITSLSQTIQAVLIEEVYPRKQIEEGIGLSINRLLQYVLWLIGFLWLATVMGFELKNLTILGGALGIGIGFGLQNIVNNFVSGIILLVERPVRIGDIVDLEGIQGSVRRVGLRATIVETFDRSEIIIPNSELITGRVVNWTLMDRTIRLKIAVGVSYSADPEKVIEILKAATAKHPAIMPGSVPAIHFMGFGESSLDFEVWVNIRNLEERLKVKTDMMKAIFLHLKQGGIEIPFPQRDIHVVSGELPRFQTRSVPPSPKKDENKP